MSDIENKETTNGENTEAEASSKQEASKADDKTELLKAQGVKALNTIKDKLKTNKNKITSLMELSALVAFIFAILGLLSGSASLIARNFVYGIMLIGLGELISLLTEIKNSKADKNE